MDEHADAVADPAVYESVDMQKWGEDAADVAKTVYEGITEN